MRFFKSKKKQAAVETPDAAAQLADNDNDGEIKALDTAVVPSLDAAEAKAELKADEPTPAPVKKEAAAPMTVRLFPGFENEPFEIGYASYTGPEYGIDKPTPMLLMRWKTGEAKWFPMPQVFNKAVLEQIHEEDNDLDRLLIGYGYDAEQLTSKPE